MFSLLLFIFSASATEDELSKNYCNIYSCKPPNFPLQNNTCIYPNLLYSSYYIQPCPSSAPYCSSNLDTLSNITCSSTPQSASLSSYPGEPCNQTSDCLFGQCTSGVCFNQGQTCKSSSDCNPGFRCSNSLCVALLKKGQTGCTTDYDCVPTAGCLKNSTTTTCVAYFSLKSNTKISLCNKMYQGGYSFLCQTGTCLITNSKTSAGICSEAPVSSNINPNLCKSNNDCKGYTSILNYTGVCTCGVNPYANSYCQPFLGDKEGISYLAALKAFVTAGYALQCNTLRRFSQQC